MFGFGSVFGSFMLEGGQVGALILMPAMVIVFGGTIATAMIGTSMSEVLGLGTLFRICLLPPRFPMTEAIDTLVSLANISRKDGLLMLERELGRLPNPFMTRLLRFAIDGTDPQVLKSIADTEVSCVAERHGRGATMFVKMGGYSPTMGIIGTVMGLIATLAAAGQDPNELIHHIASAFIATLWGVFMANLVWLPIGDKLKNIHRDEELFMGLIAEGVMGIQAGEVPSVIKAKLRSMLPGSMQEKS